MNRYSAINAAIVIVAGILGCSWAWYLSKLCLGQGLVHMEAKTLIFDLIVVAFLGLIAFALSTNLGLCAVGGWLGGQIILLVWDGLLHGGAHMFGPTNFGEALILGLVVVTVLNWPILLGALLAYLMRFLVKSGRKDSTGKQ